jgi:hypothetical protein
MAKTTKTKLPKSDLGDILTQYQLLDKITRNRRDELVMFFEQNRKFRGTNDDPVFINKGFEIIQTKLPRVVGGNAGFQVTARNEDDQPVALGIKAVAGYYADRMNLTLFLEDWAALAMQDGYAIARIEYDTESVQVADKKTGKKRTIEQYVPKPVLLSSTAFICDPSIQNLEDQEEFFDKQYYTIDGFTYLAETRKWKVNPKDVVAYSDKDEEMWKQRKFTVQDLTYMKDNGKVELLVHYKKSSGKWYRDFILNRATIIFTEAVQDIPYIKLDDYRLPNQFSSIGEVEMCIPEQTVMTDIVNNRQQNIKKALKRQVIVTEASGIDPDSVTDEEANVYVSSDPSGIGMYHMEVPDVTAGAYNEFNEMNKNIFAKAGIMDYAKGAEGSAVPNATMAKIIENAGNQRFKMFINHIDIAVAQMMKKVITFISSNMKEDLYVYITDGTTQEWMAVTKSVLSIDFDIRVEPNSLATSDSDTDVQKAMAAYQIGIQNPDICNRIEFIKDVLLALGKQNTDRFFNKQTPQAPSPQQPLQGHTQGQEQPQGQPIQPLEQQQPQDMQPTANPNDLQSVLSAIKQ